MVNRVLQGHAEIACHAKGAQLRTASCVVHPVALLGLPPGENFELRADLNSEYRDRRKDAIKRV